MKKTGIFLLCFFSSMVGGIIMTLMSVFLPVVVGDLQGKLPPEEINRVGATINSIFIFGWMFGGVFWGIVCDRLGRMRSMAFATLWYGLFTVLTAAAPSWWTITVCRFCSGFGVGGVLVTTTILVSELWTGKPRAVALGILSISIPLGIFSAGLINFLLPVWRQAFLVGSLPLAIGVIALISRAGSAAEVNAAAKNTPASSGNFLSPQYRSNLWRGSVIFGTMLIGMWAIFDWLPSWVQSVSVNTDAHQDRGLSMMLMGGGGLLGGFASGWIMHALGVRRTMLLCFSVCFIMASLLFKGNHAFSGIAYPETAVLALFFGISQGALSAYIPELFPPSIRAAATGFCFNVGRLFTATAVFFVGALVSALGGYGNAIFIFSFIFIIGFATTYYSNHGTYPRPDGIRSVHERGQTS
ncbi:MAG TPA: MFS transporter [Puia sp.]|uniref:MFS transporter n=1 Tax=Puia sp. TaxID=2045100 RepID=UPI002C793722|nr:MFS transporter [Puia sp.]HVU94088.1 MFS transporter [Puia sp.]